MKYFQYILLSFFFLLPFHAFGITFLNSTFFDVTTPAPFLLSGWKEIFLVFFFAISGLWILLHFKNTQKEFDIIDNLIVSFSLVGLLIGIWKMGEVNGENILRVILGIKYNFFFLWILFCCKHFPFTEKFFHQLKIISLVAGFFVVIFAYIQKYSSPDFLIQFGYFDAPSVDTAEKPASFCQLLENTNSCRLTSFFAGPIRFGAFLVFLSGIIFHFIFFSSDEKNKIIKKVLYSIFFISLLPLLFWTYSRGAYIAEIILLITTLFLYFNIPIFSWKIIFSSISIFGIIISSIFLSGKSDELFFREGSTEKHMQGIVESWEIMQKEPAGQGLGTAGPASANMGDEYKFLNENWYLQIFTELGFVGGIIYFLITLSIGIILYRKHSSLFPVFCALSFMALFTHLWEESSIAFILFALLGNETRNKKKIEKK